MQHSFDYAVVRVVPRVERGEFLNAGVIVFCRSLRYLRAHIELDGERLRLLAPGIDIEEVQRYLSAIPMLCEGRKEAGVIGQLTLAERFHWLVAPRSTLIQTSAVHSGICTDPEAALEALVAGMVRTPAPDRRTGG